MRSGSRFNIHFTVAAAAATAARQACRIGDQQTVKLSTSWSIVVYDLPATASIKNCLELIRTSRPGFHYDMADLRHV